jgi:hypothetical protein
MESKCDPPYPPNARGRDAHRLRHRRVAPQCGIVRRLLHGLRDQLQSDFCGAMAAPIEIPLLPAPDGRLRHTHLPHVLDRVLTVRRRQQHVGAPRKLMLPTAVTQQSSKLSAVGGGKEKADVGASHTPMMPQPGTYGNPM